MELGHLFEALMLVCFGFSWPLNVRKAYKARTAKGTSLAFILLIITGYIAGITAKIINNQFNYVLAVYFLNLAIVATNVIIYFRNVALDKKKLVKDTKKKIYEIQLKHKEEIKNLKEENNKETDNKSNAMEANMNYQELNKMAKKNGVILLGGALDKEIPVTELAEAFGFNFNIYNRSEKRISVKMAKDFFDTNVKSLEPEGMILHIGENDVSLFQSNPTEFDKYYLELISSIKLVNKKCRIALISVNNEKNDKVLSNMNAHIKAIADAEKCSFVNVDNAKLWNPKATKAAVDFAYSMGLNTKKPLNDVAEILYSYAYVELRDEVEESMVG